MFQTQGLCFKHRPFMTWIAAIVTLLLILRTGVARASSISGGSVSDPDYPPQVWDPIISHLIQSKHARVNFGVARKWLEIESGGNPCAFGVEGENGSDGNPKEIGLGQAFNPDDFSKQGLHSAPFRAYCIPGTQHRNRKLTAQEMIDQVEYTLLFKIEEGIDKAKQLIAEYNLPWTGSDFWKLVKAPHAWPPIYNQGLPSVIKKLGRAPTSWSEFRTVLGMDGYDVVEGKIRYRYPLWHRGLNACEECGNAASSEGVV